MYLLDTNIILELLLDQDHAALLARRPDDTERRYRAGDPLIREALDRGKVLYNRGGERS